MNSHIIYRSSIIIKHIPDEERGKYTIRQINKQAVVYEAFMYHYKLSYDTYGDISTLEDRVIWCAKLAQGILIRKGLPRPHLIVKIDTENK